MKLSLYKVENASGLAGFDVYGKAEADLGEHAKGKTLYSGADVTTRGHVSNIIDVPLTGHLNGVSYSAQSGMGW